MASKALTVAQATLPGLLLVDREPPDAMTRLSMVRSPGYGRIRAVRHPWSPDPVTQSPWDQRLARIVVRPLASTPVHPNHLTALSLFLGLASGALFAFGGAGAAGWAALVFMLAVFIDHTDGELARLTAKTSEFGHRLDYIVGAANYTALFIGIGAGLYAQGLGVWALILGLAAGLSNPVICALRLGI